MSGIPISAVSIGPVLCCTVLHFTVNLSIWITPPHVSCLSFVLSLSHISVQSGEQCLWPVWKEDCWRWNLQVPHTHTHIALWIVYTPYYWRSWSGSNNAQNAKESLPLCRCHATRPGVCWVMLMTHSVKSMQAGNVFTLPEFQTVLFCRMTSYKLSSWTTILLELCVQGPYIWIVSEVVCWF